MRGAAPAYYSPLCLLWPSEQLTRQRLHARRRLLKLSALHAALDTCRLLLPGNPGLCAAADSSVSSSARNGSFAACLLRSGSGGESWEGLADGFEPDQPRDAVHTKIKLAADNQPRPSCPTASMQLPACSADMLSGRRPANDSRSGRRMVGGLTAAVGGLTLLAAAVTALARRLAARRHRRLRWRGAVSSEAEGLQLLQQVPGLQPELTRRMLALKQQGRIVLRAASRLNASSGRGGFGGAGAPEPETLSLQKAIASGPLSLRISHLTFVEADSSSSSSSSSGNDETRFVQLGSGATSTVSSVYDMAC